MKEPDLFDTSKGAGNDLVFTFQVCTGSIQLPHSRDSFAAVFFMPLPEYM